MGSFNSSCAVTNLSISHEKVVLIPALKKTPFKEDDPYFFSSESGTFELYFPIFLPIFGTIGEYGELYDIEENEGTRFLENRFKMSIDEIANAMLNSTYNNESDENSIVLKDDRYVEAVIVHRDVYDYMSKHCFSDFTKDLDYWSLWDCRLYYGLQEVSLRILGFVPFENNWIHSAEKKLLYLHNGRVRGEFLFDGKGIGVDPYFDSFSVVFKTLLSLNANIDFDAWERYAKNSPSNKELVCNTEFLKYGWRRPIVNEYENSSLYDKGFTQYAEESRARFLRFFDNEEDKSSEKAQQYLDIIKKYDEDVHDVWHEPKFKEGFLLGQLCDLDNFIDFLRDCNKHFVPASRYGPQFGNRKAEKEMIGLTMRLYDKILKQEEE